MLKYYLAELFEPTLLYSLALAVLGISAAYHYGHFSAVNAILLIIGSVLAQMSVNVISDYFDYTSGLDKELAKKKSGNLAGGSSLIAEGKIKPIKTLLSGIITLMLAAIIGFYFLTIHPVLFPIILLAGISILLYARVVKRIPYLSEPLCTLNYTLIAYGSFIAMAGISAVNYQIAFAFIPAGIMLGGNALFVNEIPDRKTDKKYGVRHSAVMLGTSRKIAAYYLLFQLVAYLILVTGILVSKLSIFSISALVVLPITPYIFNGIYNAYSDKYAKYLGLHTIASFAFALLLSAAFLIPVL